MIISILLYRYILCNSGRNFDKTTTVIYNTETESVPRAPQQSLINGPQISTPVTIQPAISSDREQLSQEMFIGVPFITSEHQPVQHFYPGHPAGQYMFYSPFRYMHYTDLNTGHQIIVEQHIQPGMAMVPQQQPNTADVTEITLETEQQAPSTSVNITNDTEIKTAADSKTSQSSKTISTVKSQGENIDLSSNDSKIVSQKQATITGQNKRITAKESNKKEIPGPKRKLVTKK
ncbi:unnamed protein product [Mytilus edulis]|uniref:Uncharacterized protein n=1 Tax=Mytilus edulis TaxID=6550 RepID=A0A8S3V087_MYTED|nr:unnamed protein product [Mytilus edulis]